MFADTYDIPKHVYAKQLCDLMYDHTDKMLSPEIRREAAEKKMSLHDLMMIASMVEKRKLSSEKIRCRLLRLF